MAPRLTHFLDWIKSYQDPAAKLLNPPDTGKLTSGNRISDYAGGNMPSGYYNAATACQYYENLRIASCVFSALGRQIEAIVTVAFCFVGCMILGCAMEKLLTYRGTLRAFSRNHISWPVIQLAVCGGGFVVSDIYVRPSRTEAATGLVSRSTRISLPGSAVLSIRIFESVLP